MRKKRGGFLSFILIATMCMSLCACGKNDGTESAGGGSDTFANAVDQMKIEGGGEENSVEGVVGFTVLDSSTVKASINDPRILAYAIDMTEIKLMLFPDEASIESKNAAIIFKIQFNEIDGQMHCNVYLQSCRTEQEAENTQTIYEEDILGLDGAPLCGAATVTDYMLSFVVQNDDLGSIIENNPYYATYIDYKEYTRGKIKNAGPQEMLTPDLSATSLADAVDISRFAGVRPNYVVIEEDFAPYKSYSGHKFVDSINEYRHNAVELLWVPTSNSDISKKAVLVASVDEFGIAGYDMAVVYDSHKDLIRDYMADEAINFSLEFGIDEPNADLITDDLLERCIPQDSSDMFGSWEYSVDDNVLYWHYVPDFNAHYKSDEDFNVPFIQFEYAGIDGGPSDLNTKLGEIVNEVVSKGEAEGRIDYSYYWDDMSQSAVNSSQSKSSVTYKGYYHKAEGEEESAASLTEADNESIKEETLRIRNEILTVKDAEDEAKKNAPQTIDPEAECYMYDDDSADYMLRNLDTDMLASGGAYEIEFDGYVIRLTAASMDAPTCEIGKYNGDSFEKISDTPCYRNIDVGPNAITVNANISAIEGVGWKQVKNIDLYELKDGKTRSRIDKEININRWYQ